MDPIEEATVNSLTTARSQNTSLITMFVPYKYSFGAFVKKELGTARSIKSNQTRKLVIDALSKIDKFVSVAALNEFRNGLVIYAGDDLSYF